MNNYINEMEGEYAEKEPLTMEDCAKIAEECLTGRLSVSLMRRKKYAPIYHSILMFFINKFLTGCLSNHG